MLPGDVVDQLLDQDGLAGAGAAEEADLAALHVRRDQVDDLDARSRRSRSSARGRGKRAGRGGSTSARRPCRRGACLVDRLADHVPDPAQRRVADGNRDRRAGVDDIGAAREAVGRVHRDGADAIVAEVLLHLRDQRPRAAVAARRPRSRGRCRSRAAVREDGVDDDALDLDDPAGVPAVVRLCPAFPSSRWCLRVRQCAAGRPSARSLARGSSCTCSGAASPAGAGTEGPWISWRLRRQALSWGKEMLQRCRDRGSAPRSCASAPPAARGVFVGATTSTRIPAAFATRCRPKPVGPASWKHGPAAATCRASRRPAGWCQSGGGVSSPLVTSIAAASVERAWTSSPQPAADGAPDVIRATKSGNRNSRSTWARAMPPTQVCAPPRLHPNRSPPRSTVVQGGSSV